VVLVPRTSTGLVSEHYIVCVYKIVKVMEQDTVISTLITSWIIKKDDRLKVNRVRLQYK
jgi:hypothetical protein